MHLRLHLLPLHKITQMSTSFVVGVFALGAGWCIGVLNSPYPGGIDIPYYQSPLEVPIALIAIALAWALLFPSKKPTGALTACPATAWPHGKPMIAKPADYPVYDLRDPKGSFNKICDMLIAEVKDELPQMYELPVRENEWINKMLEYNTKGGKMTRGLMVVETAKIIFKARALVCSRPSQPHSVPDARGRLAGSRSTTWRCASSPCSAGASSGCRRGSWWPTTSWTSRRRAAASRAGAPQAAGARGL